MRLSNLITGPLFSVIWRVMLLLSSIPWLWILAKGCPLFSWNDNSFRIITEVVESSTFSWNVLVWKSIRLIDWIVYSGPVVIKMRRVLFFWTKLSVLASRKPSRRSVCVPALQNSRGEVLVAGVLEMSFVSPFWVAKTLKNVIASLVCKWPKNGVLKNVMKIRYFK